MLDGRDGVPDRWNVFGGLVSVVLGVCEVAYWQRRMRSRKLQTGVEQPASAVDEAIRA
jgi:hypothetical protein